MTGFDDVTAAVDAQEGEDPLVARKALNRYGLRDQVSVLATREATGGGGGSVLTVSKPLTNADIIALGTEVPFTILAAPGAGKFYAMQYGIVAVDASAVAYGNVNASAGIAISASGALLGGANSYIPVLLGDDGVAAWMPFFPVQTVGENTGDQSLTLLVGNFGAGAFIGGDPANSGYVKVWYTLEDLP